jgi:hypothetical protein
LHAGSRDAILEFTSEFGELGELFHSFDSIRDAIIHFKMMVHALDSPVIDRHGAAIIFQDMFRSRFGMTMDAEDLRPVFLPETLYGALAVQIAEEIAGTAGGLFPLFSAVYWHVLVQSGTVLDCFGTEGAGFEPAMELPPYTLSRRAPSTARPPLRKAPRAEPGGTRRNSSGAF